MKKVYISLTTLLLSLIAPILLNAQSTSVFDANYFNRDNSVPPIKIGKGFHINDIYKQTRSCFSSETSNSGQLSSQQTGGKKTFIRLFYTRTNEEFNDFKTRGASGKVSFLNLFSLGGQKLEKYSNKNIHDEERLIFSANIDFGIYSFDNEPTLNTEAKSLIDQNRVQDFVKIYGTHYISGIRKESSISVILTKTNIKTEGDENTSTSLQTSATIPFKGSGSFEVENGNWMNKQLEENVFSLSIEINGPIIDKSDLQGRINDLLTKNVQDKASSLAEIIEGALKNISDPNQSLITQYYYSPFSLYGLDGIYWDEKKQSQLAKINEAVIKVYSSKSQLEELVTQSGKEQIEKELRDNNVPENYINQITGKYNEILPNLNLLSVLADNYLKELETRYINCSDVFCQSNLSCCNNGPYISEVNNFNFEKKIENELEKVMDVARNVAAEISKPECEKNNQGIITIKNLSPNPYNLYQGTKFIEAIPGNSEQIYNVDMGTYNFKAVQVLGYVLYPTENLRSASITKVCQEIILKIGFED